MSHIPHRAEEGNLRKPLTNILTLWQIKLQRDYAQRHK